MGTTKNPRGGKRGNDNPIKRAPEDTLARESVPTAGAELQASKGRVEFGGGVGSRFDVHSLSLAGLTVADEFRRRQRILDSLVRGFCRLEREWQPTAGMELTANESAYLMWIQLMSLLQALTEKIPLTEDNVSLVQAACDAVRSWAAKTDEMGMERGVRGVTELVNKWIKKGEMMGGRRLEEIIDKLRGSERTLQELERERKPLLNRVRRFGPKTLSREGVQLYVEAWQYHLGRFRKGKKNRKKNMREFCKEHPEIVNKRPDSFYFRMAKYMRRHPKPFKSYGGKNI